MQTSFTATGSKAVSSARSSHLGNCNGPHPGGSTMVSGRKDSDVAQGDRPYHTGNPATHHMSQLDVQAADGHTS